MQHSKSKQIFFNAHEQYGILDSPRTKPKDQIAYEGL